MGVLAINSLPAARPRSPRPSSPARVSRLPIRSIPTLAVSIAALLFVAWISLAGNGRHGLYADPPNAVGAH